MDMYYEGLWFLKFSPLQSKLYKPSESVQPQQWPWFLNGLEKRMIANSILLLLLHTLQLLKPLMRPLKKTTHSIIWSKRLMVLLQLLSLLKSLSSWFFLWLYYLHLSMNPLCQLFPSLIKFVKHHHWNRINAMFYQSTLREPNASSNHNCKGGLLQVSVLICKLSLSKIHTWCQGTEYKNARRSTMKICIIKFDGLTNEKAKDYWKTYTGSVPWWADTSGISEPTSLWVPLHTTPAHQGACDMQDRCF